MKITVKHYLNKRLKPKKVERKGKSYNAYPLYVQVLVKGKQAQIKSRLDYFTGLPQLSNDAVDQHYFLFGKDPKNEPYYFTQTEFKSLEINPIYELIIEETKFIEYVIEYQLTNLGTPNLSAISPLMSELLDDYYDVKIFNENEVIAKLAAPLFNGIPNIEKYFFTAMYDVVEGHGVDAKGAYSLIISFLDEISILKGDIYHNELEKVKDYLHLISLRFEFSDFLSEGQSSGPANISVYTILHSSLKLKWYEFLEVKIPNDRRKRIGFYKESIKRLYNYEYQIFKNV